MKRGQALYRVLFPTLAWLPLAATAADYRTSTLDETPPAEELAPAIARQLEPTGTRVIQGEDRAIADFWFVKGSELPADFEPSAQVLYPFEPGELVGVVRLPRRGSDFRDQRIPRGVYTLRYAQQPVDGNHEGTSPTRDFLLLVSPEEDRSAEPIEEEELNDLSAEAIGALHPAMFSMQPPQANSEQPTRHTLRHDESRDWWILEQTIQTVRDGETHALPVAIVVVGHADE